MHISFTLSLAFSLSVSDCFVSFPVILPVRFSDRLFRVPVPVSFHLPCLSLSRIQAWGWDFHCPMMQRLSHKPRVVVANAGGSPDGRALMKYLSTYIEGRVWALFCRSPSDRLLPSLSSQSGSNSPTQTTSGWIEELLLLLLLLPSAATVCSDGKVSTDFSA